MQTVQCLLSVQKLSVHGKLLVPGADGANKVGTDMISLFCLILTSDYSIKLCNGRPVLTRKNHLSLMLFGNNLRNDVQRSCGVIGESLRRTAGRIWQDDLSFKAARCVV